jgi:large conductance mechanosensitive channel
VSWRVERRGDNIEANSVDLGLAGIVGATQGSIVSSLVDGAVLPTVGRVLSGSDVSRLSDAVTNPNSVAVGPDAPLRSVAAARQNIGLFTNAVVKFLIAAFVLFLFVRGINANRNEQAAALAA